jgi:hypothetical protein
MGFGRWVGTLISPTTKSQAQIPGGMQKGQGAQTPSHSATLKVSSLTLASTGGRDP